MEIWLDTIDLEVIADAEKIGILSGVTTNPSILSRTRAISKKLSTILDIQSGPVAVQVTSQDPQGMIEEGRRIFAFSSRMLVKVPIDHVVYCASLGVEAVTIKPDLYDKLIEVHPLVERFSKKFLFDWTQVHGELSIREVLETH